jgi:DNA topoisomerase-1
VKHGKINATVPRDHEPEQVTVEEAVALIAAKSKGGAKKAAPKKTSSKKAKPKKSVSKKSAGATQDKEPVEEAAG